MSPVQGEPIDFTPKPPTPVVWPRESRLVLWGDFLRGVGFAAAGLGFLGWLIVSLIAGLR